MSLLLAIQRPGGLGTDLKPRSKILISIIIKLYCTGKETLRVLLRKRSVLKHMPVISTYCAFKA